MTTIADSGFVISVAVSTDKQHRICAKAYYQHPVIYLPQSTLTEIAFFLTKAGGNQATAFFLKSLAGSHYRVISLQAEDIGRTAEILDEYHDSRLDFVDASIVAVAERLAITRVLTLDKRDFGIVRPRHVEFFELLPS